MVLGGCAFLGVMPVLGMPHMSRYHLPAAVLRVGQAGGCVIGRGDEKLPNWYLSLLTADIKDLSLTEQKGNDVFLFDQAVFPL